MLTRLLRAVPLDTIDGRSQVGVALRRIREELVAQLGGDITPAEAILIDEIARKAVIVRAVGEWIMGQETLVQPEGRLLEVVMQHDRLTATLATLLERLGLERRAKPFDLPAELAQLHRAAPSASAEPSDDDERREATHGERAGRPLPSEDVAARPSRARRRAQTVASSIQGSTRASARYRLVIGRRAVENPARRPTLFSGRRRP